MRSIEEITAALSPLQPSPLSRDEILCFFAYLPASPLLIARTGAPWKPIPLTTQWYVPYKRELRPVGEHPIAAPGVWENHVGPALLAVLDQENVQWNTIDVHRIHYIEFDHEAPFPVVVCIGVKFGLLTGQDGARVAERCQAVLDDFGLADVEVAIKASERFQLAAPAFEEPGEWIRPEKDPMAKSRMPFTFCVGFPLSNQARPGVQGSGGFFFTNGEDTSKVYLVTARHAVIETTTREKNTVYDHNSSARPRRQDVTLFNEQSILDHMQTIRAELGSQSIDAEVYQRQVEYMQGKLNDKMQAGADRIPIALIRHQDTLERAQESMVALETFYADAAKLYLSDLGRLLGFVSYAPPIGFSVGEHKYTEDVAIIELDANKIDPSTFRPNVLDIGSERSLGDLTAMMGPRGSRGEDRASPIPFPFPFPLERLLELRGGIVPDAELRAPQQKDFNDDPCLMVLKRGAASGVTTGRLNNVPSYTRTYWADGTSDVSMEWPIFGYLHEKHKYARSFSERGDSGAVVVDGAGRIAGILTSAAGLNDPSVKNRTSPLDDEANVTYMMAADFIRDQMLTRGVDMNVNFTL
ncbi:hypothetical protein GSI_08435 [Ganoderma sinense ZZ0214-1]|uniref:Uncharacterized protein n=1 Tax=Ganoderma sinense ZZ0214-1 TaxID=1077348 RepID=A0A2G8S6U1_9APHY|nr:hypothetical protein GSI_08435 [Ganoderma sinense ZZ0214-1]